MGNVWSKYVSDIVHSIEFHSHFSSENISCKKINDIFTGIITTKEFMNTKNTTFIGSRWFYAICFIGLFIVETLIALFVRDAFIRPYMGDVLVVILIYCFVRIFITEPLRGLPLWIFLFACCIETLQYLQLVTLLGLQNCTLARVVLGTSFSWWDIVCYAVGCLPLLFIRR